MTTGLLNPCTSAQKPGLERTRFFPRQLVTPEDLTQDQVYFQEKSRRHNRMLHGWGVVCGACVRKGKGNCEVIVEPGYLLGPWGDDIVIPNDHVVDVCKARVKEQLGCCDPAPLDPWCDDDDGDCPQGTMYLAIKYAECQSRPVRAHQSGCGCGCDESACEYSRIRDGYAIALLPELPPTYSTPMRQPTWAELLPSCIGRLRRVKPCPPCPESPWVILADITVGRDCRVVGIDCFAHQRQVVSFASFYLACSPVPTFTGSMQDASRIAQQMSAMRGDAGVVDLEAMAGSTPTASVAMLRPDGSPATFPAFFTVRPGETAAALLEREGDRSYYDPLSDEVITLRTLYAHAGVADDAVFTGTASALAPLEGRTLPVGRGLDRPVLEEVLDRKGLDRLDRELGGAPDRATELPATLLVGVGPRSTLGRFVAEMTIDEVAGQTQDEFAEAAAETAPARRKADVRRQAATVWRNAIRVRKLR